MDFRSGKWSTHVEFRPGGYGGFDWRGRQRSVVVLRRARHHGGCAWGCYLGGQQEGRRPGQPLQTTEQLLAAADVENGRRVFLQNCSVCHGEDGKSGHGAAPSLASVKDLEMVMTTVSNGRNAMPSFRTFTAEQVRDVAGFVVKELASAPR